MTGRVGPSVGRVDILHQLIDFTTQSYFPEVLSASGCVSVCCQSVSVFSSFLSPTFLLPFLCLLSLLVTISACLCLPLSYPCSQTHSPAIATNSMVKEILLNSLWSEFSSQGHFHTLQLLHVNISQFLFCRVVRLKTAPGGNFSHP